MQSKLSLVLTGTLATFCAGTSLRAQCGESNFGPVVVTGDDAVSLIRPLGFAFPFNGTTYTDIYISTNGLVYLSNAGVPAAGGSGCCSGSTVQLVAGGPKLAPFWQDHVASTGGTVHFNALPGRAVVTWKDVYEFAIPATRYTFQMQIDVAGSITFAYDNRCVLTTVGDGLIGLSEGAPAVAGLPVDWSTVGITTTVTNYEIFNNTTLLFDMANQSVTLAPNGPTGYVWATQPCPTGSHVSYGTGCYPGFSSYGSYYELFTAATFDLANSAITMAYAGGGYLVLPGQTTYVAPSGAAVSLPLFDDSSTTVTLSAPFPHSTGATTVLTVHSNGFVSVAPGNTNLWTPTVATMLNSPATAFWCWHDFNVTIPGSGQVKFEEVAGIAYITWDAVYSFGTSNPETMQFQLELATGNVHWVSTTLGGFGNGYLVGYSPGGASSDPGPTDISVALPLGFSVSATDLSTQLVLSSPANAVPGQTVTFSTSGIPQFVPPVPAYLALHILSNVPIPAPGIDLAPDAAGCPLLIASFDSIAVMLGVSETLTASYPVPPLTPIGVSIASQSWALFTPFSMPGGQNAAGLTTSNGLITTVGNW